MRAQLPSFRSELRAYRRRFEAITPRPDYYPLVIEILDSWENHASAEAIWNTINENLPIPPTAGQLIDLVLARRINVAEELYRVIREAPGVKASKRARIKRRLKNEAEWQAGAKTFTALADFREREKRVLGREKKTAPRKLFESGWRDQFKKECGQPLDEVVRVLSEIAFGGQRTIEAVRDAQRRDRGTRPPK